MSLLMATAMLAVGGLGLFVYGNKDKTHNDSIDPEIYDEELDEEDIEDKKTNGGSSIKSFFDNMFTTENEKEKEKEKEKEEYVEEEHYYEPKARAKKSKTKRQRKSVGTKRRY